MTFPSVSVVLPAFNEAQSLIATVTGAVLVLDELVVDFEIVIVDDGSTDDSPKICRELGVRHSHVRVIRHPRNRGYGAALRTGFDAAERDLIFFTDADGQFRFDQLPEFLERIDNADAVIGYRMERRDSWLRKINARLGNWLARALLGVRVRDINCACKLLRRDLLRQLPLMANGAMINTELLACAQNAGWRFDELPVRHYPRKFGRSTGANVSVILRIILEFFQLRRRVARLDLARAATRLPLETVGRGCA